jgi:pimeloyl-ACP methyl ester carboxylesterase
VEASAGQRTVVLVHGAAHGAWAWDKVVPGLRAAGVDVVALDLPGQGADTGPILDLHGDAERVRAAVAAVPGPVVLVGHSYGGAVITEAGTEPNVEELVYIAALPLAEDETCATAAASDPRMAYVDHAGRPVLQKGFRISDDGAVVRMDPAHAAICFYHDCSPEDVAWATERLGNHSFRAFGQTPKAVAWRAVPSTYVVCGEDRTLHPGQQRILAERCTDQVEWSSGHSPMLSQPQLVVELLVDLATAPA